MRTAGGPVPERTVTVTCARQNVDAVSNARYRVSFSRLPGWTFGPWDFAETIRDLTVSALLSPAAARGLVLDAHVLGSAQASVDWQDGEVR